MSERWHGTLGGYNNHRCRCTQCRSVFAAYHRERRRGLVANGLCVDCRQPTTCGVRCERHAAVFNDARKRHYRKAHLTKDELFDIVAELATSGSARVLRKRARAAIAKAEGVTTHDAAR